MLKAPEDLNEVLQGDFTDYVTEDGEKYRIGGITEYLSLSAHPNSDLHCAYDTQFSGVHEPERPQALAAEPKTVYLAESAAAAGAALQRFSWALGRSTPRFCGHVAMPAGAGDPFFSYPLEVRKIIYTTNAIESLHMQLRKIIKNRGHFPNDDAAVKLLYLAKKRLIGR